MAKEEDRNTLVRSDLCIEAYTCRTIVDSLVCLESEWVDGDEHSIEDIPILLHIHNLHYRLVLSYIFEPSSTHDSDIQDAETPSHDR